MMTRGEIMLAHAERVRQQRDRRDRRLHWLQLAGIVSALCLSIAAVNPAPRSLTAAVRDSWACTKAKRACVQANPQCAVCGARSTFLGRGLEAHHIIPVAASVAQGHPEWASDSRNLTAVCRNCHGWVCHRQRNFREYNANLPATIAAVRAAVDGTAQWREDRP